MTRPLRVGVLLPEVERDVRWPEYVAMASAAEDVGFDSIWTGDHLLYRNDGRFERGPWETWTLLAGLAAVTSRVTLGPLVACTAFHPPGLIAKQAATVDEISGGRITLAVGAGWNDVEFRAFDLPYDHRVSRFEEAFTIIRRLVAGERVTFDGTFHSVDDAVLLPAPARRMPLMVGSSGERMLSITLPWVDSWNTWFDLSGNTAAGFEAELAKARSRHAMASLAFNWVYGAFLTALGIVGMEYGNPALGLLDVHKSMMAEGPCPPRNCTEAMAEAHGCYINLMNKTYKRLGVGIYIGSGAVWLTEDFTS